MNYNYMIAYDFDGVLCDTMPAFMQHWKAEYNFDMRQHSVATWDMPLPEGYDLKNIYQDIIDAHNNYQSYLMPYAFALPAVRELANRYNETPVIITARKDENREVTEQWLKVWLGIPYILHMVGTPGESKENLINNDKIKYFVEDRFRTCNQIVQRSGVWKCFMPDRPWNWNREPQDDVIRVNSMLDVFDWIIREEEPDINDPDFDPTRKEEYGN